MSTDIDKAKIIAAINETDDERILFAINRLLLIGEEDIPGWHKQVLDERTEKIKNGQEHFYDWDDVKDGIKKAD